MPFGLTNAPAVFQALVNDNRDEHVHHVQAVLQPPLENSLFVKAEKSGVGGVAPLVGGDPSSLFWLWTDHKNLEYIRSAKTLNSRQAGWLLFLTRFNFTLSYRPGSRNVKPDALSCQFQRDEDVAPCPDTIISSSHLVALLTWEIEERVKAAQESQPGPSACPQYRLFVPPSLRSDVLQWAHSSRLTCHPGIQRTIDVVRQRFWWVTVNEDTRGFVKACPICNPPHSCRSPAAPALCPVVPGLTSLWTSSLALPPSHGHTAILAVVDRFSKMAHFVPLPKLPFSQGDRRTDADTCIPSAWTSCGHSFRLGSSPQFTSIFWREFCALVGASASLSSGFHPQSNVQTERMNQELETALRCIASQHPSSWSQQLLWVEYAHNTLTCSATGLSPFQCAYGFLAPPVS
ncbi:hypothetical protein L3Q82_002169 [Scortum barcoo]|uniref:Uncharacterized protein n=1 Tax=Scortum barcoo TaxID=214431 RepID=A0ACB8W2D5_9TELE|nr:hypothetical protein L3Q82_002169 [Scortum barcoo]